MLQNIKVYGMAYLKFSTIDTEFNGFLTQKKIVTKIDTLFAKIDSGTQSLEKAKRLLEKYRQSVLKHAFEGKLTAKWREENKDKREPASVLLEFLGSKRSEKRNWGRSIRSCHLWMQVSCPNCQRVGCGVDWGKCVTCY